MGHQTLKIGQKILLIWGGTSLTLIVLFVSYLTYSMTIGNKDEIDKATRSDVRFVLNWCELGDDRIENVVKSYISGRSFTGDHIDAYAIKISHVSIDELNKPNIVLGRWYRCDSLPKVLDDAVSFVSGSQYDFSWFPKENELRTKDYYVYPQSIYCHGITPTAAELIFIDPKKRLVYYISLKI